MINPGLHSCLLASVKVTLDVSDLWESRWWAQHRSSWLQILGNWILQELRRQTPPCMCLRNANNPNQLVEHETDAAGVRVWRALFVGSHGFNLSPNPLGAQIHSFLQGEMCGCLSAAGCWSFCPSENFWCRESGAIQFYSHSKGSGSVWKHSSRWHRQEAFSNMSIPWYDTVFSLS